MKNIEGWAARTFLLACVSLILAVADARAAAWTVTKVQDTDDGACDADCSLREAVAVAAPGDTINFSSLFDTPQTIALSPLAPYDGGLTIPKSLIIDGPGADLLTIASGGGEGVLILSGAGVSLIELTISGAGATGVENFGDLTLNGCVITGNDGSGVINNGGLTITHSTVSENTGDSAGGIVNNGFLTITNSTISHNAAADTNPGGGGIFNTFSLTIENSTISGNAKLGGDYNGGGVYQVTVNSPVITEMKDCTITNNSADGANSASGVLNISGSMLIGNTIIAANVNNSATPDVVGTPAVLLPGGITSLGFNLIGHCGAGLFTFLNDQKGTAASPLDPLLDPLGDYGGTTHTHRLQANSTAIDKGSSSATEDQRGYSRPFDKPNYGNAWGGDGSDIGAYELQFGVVITGIVYTPVGVPLRNVRVLLRAANGESRAVRTDRFGIYRFRDVATNRMYQVSATHRRCASAPQVVQVREEDIGDLNFTCIPASLP